MIFSVSLHNYTMYYALRVYSFSVIMKCGVGFSEIHISVTERLTDDRMHFYIIYRLCGLGGNDHNDLERLSNFGKLSKFLLLFSNDSIPLWLIHTFTKGQLSVVKFQDLKSKSQMGHR